MKRKEPDKEETAWSLKLYRIARRVKAVDVVTKLRQEGLKIDPSKLSLYESGRVAIPPEKLGKIKKAIEELSK